MRCLDPRILWVSISRKAELDGALFGLTGSGWSKQDEFDLHLLDSTFGSQLWDIVCKTDRCHHFVPAGTLLCCRALQIRYVVKANRFWRRGGDLIKYCKKCAILAILGFSQWISQAMPRELFFPDLWRTKGRCWYLDLPLFPAQQQNRRVPD